MTANDFDRLPDEEKVKLVDNETLVKLTNVEFPIEGGMLISYKAFEDDRVTAVYPISSSLWPFCKTCQTYYILGVNEEGVYTIDNTSCYSSMWINNPPVCVELIPDSPRTTFAFELAMMFKDTI